MARTFDRTLGDAVLAMAPGEALLIQRTDNGVKLTAASRASRKLKQSNAVLDVNLVPPEALVRKTVAEAVAGLFETTRSKQNAMIEAANKKNAAQAAAKRKKKG